MLIAPRATPLRCALCHDGLPGEAATCTDCGTLVHEECQLDRCPTIGCCSPTPWEWVETGPAPARSGRRAPRVGRVVALLAAGSLLAAPQAPAAATAPPQEPATATCQWDSAWFKLGRGSLLETRTTCAAPVGWMRISCGFVIDEQGRRRGFGEQTVSWSTWVEEESRSRHRLLWLLPGHARVEVEVRSPGGRLRERTRPRFPKHAPSLPAAGEILERGLTSVSIPAGVFPCTYLKIRVVEVESFPAVVETWSSPNLPLPFREVVTWRDPIGPAHLRSVRETALVSLDLRPPDPRDSSGAEPPAANLGSVHPSRQEH